MIADESDTLTILLTLVPIVCIAIASWCHDGTTGLEG